MVQHNSTLNKISSTIFYNNECSNFANGILLLVSIITSWVPDQSFHSHLMALTIPLGLGCQLWITGAICFQENYEYQGEMLVTQLKDVVKTNSWEQVIDLCAKIKNYFPVFSTPKKFPVTREIVDVKGTVSRN